jgi:murein endopeptidase
MIHRADDETEQLLAVFAAVVMAEPAGPLSVGHVAHKSGTSVDIYIVVCRLCIYSLKK